MSKWNAVAFGSLLLLAACSRDESPPQAAITVTVPAPTPTVSESDYRACDNAYWFAITYTNAYSVARKPRHYPDNSHAVFAQDLRSLADIEAESPELQRALRQVAVAVEKWQGNDTRLARAVSELNEICLKG